MEDEQILRERGAVTMTAAGWLVLRHISFFLTSLVSG